jgi:hypothetical protein
VDNLRACCASLDGTQALGVDGVTNAMYGPNLEAHLQALPQPLRRGEMPQGDGSTRPLGRSGVEDKIVQEMARRILEAL